MKHRYSKISMVLYYIIVTLAAWGVLIILPILINQTKLIMRLWLAFIILPCVAIVDDYKRRGNRYVEFFNNYVCINSVSFKNKREAFTFNIKYEDIKRIKAKILPIFGIHSIYVEANNVGRTIKLPHYFIKYNEMCKTLYECVIIANPDAEIDDNLIKFFKEKEKT